MFLNKLKIFNNNFKLCQNFNLKTNNNNALYSLSYKAFTGKTETGWKYTTPLMKMKSCKLTIPPPGDNLQIPGIIFPK